jgi:hypothetical protein
LSFGFDPFIVTIIKLVKRKRVLNISLGLPITKDSKNFPKRILWLKKSIFYFYVPAIPVAARWLKVGAKPSREKRLPLFPPGLRLTALIPPP